MSPSISSEQGRPQSILQSPSHHLQISVLSLLALAQAALVAWSGSGIPRVAAVLLALAGLNAQLRTLWALAALIVVNFGVHLWRLGGPIPLREAHVALPLLYGAATLAALTSFFATARFRTTFAIYAVPAVGLIAAEVVVPHVVPPLVLGVRPAWFDMARGGPAPDDDREPYALMRTTYPDNPRGYFRRSGDGQGRGPSGAAGVDYSLNALGCRDDDHAVPNPHDRNRILVLGGAGAFGVGVHAADTLAVRLEHSLGEGAGASRLPVEVINCGISGSSTADQRAFYEQIASRYEPDVVLLVVGERDNLSRADERQRGLVHEAGRLEQLSAVARVVQWGRHEGRRPFEYDAVGEEVSKLDEAVRSRGARLAVAIFRTGDLDARWGSLVHAVSAKLGGRDIPFRDLGLALLKGHNPRELAVHPTDSNPNEIAHREGAAEVERLLRAGRLID